MANFFDQFDEPAGGAGPPPAAPKPPRNFFDQFDPQPSTFGNIDVELTKAMKQGAEQTTGQALEGIARLTTDDPQKIATVEKGIANLKTMTPEAATAFVRSIPSLELNPVSAINYQAGIRAMWRGDQATADEYFKTARAENYTKPVPQQNLYKTGKAIEHHAATSPDYMPAAGWEDSYTRQFGTLAGQSAPFLGVAAVTGPLSPFAVAAFGAGAQTEQEHQTGEQELAKVQSDERNRKKGVYTVEQAPNSYLKGLNAADAQRLINRASKMAAVPGASEDVPIELLLNQTVARIPWLRPFANSPKFRKFMTTLGRLTLNAAAEGGQEAGQQVATNAITKLELNPDQALDEQVWQNFFAGALLGTAFQAPAEVHHYFHPVPEEAPPGGQPPPGAPPGGGPGGPPGGAPPGGAGGPPGGRIDPRLFPQGAPPGGPPGGAAGPSNFFDQFDVPPDLEGANAPVNIPHTPAPMAPRIPRPVQLPPVNLPPHVPGSGFPVEGPNVPGGAVPAATVQPVQGVAPPNGAPVRPLPNAGQQEGGAQPQTLPPGAGQATGPGQAGYPAPLAPNDPSFAGLDFAQQRIEADYRLAHGLGVVPDIERMSAEGKTAQQMVKELGPRLDRVGELAALNGEPHFADMNKQGVIRAVRHKLGIPSIDERQDFAAWKAAYNQRQQAQAPTTTASVPFMLTNAMRGELARRGYTKEQIAFMKPEEAQAILSQPAGQPAPQPIPPIPQPIPQPAPQPVPQPQPGFGAANTVVTPDRAAQIRAQLQAKLAAQAAQPAQSAPINAQPQGEAAPPATVSEQAPVLSTGPAEINDAHRAALTAFLRTRQPVNEKNLARHAKLDPGTAARLIQHGIMRGSILQTRKGLIRAPVRIKPLNVMEAIASYGGIRDDGGEMRNLGVTVENKKVNMTSVGPVVRAGGLSPDDVRARLVEDGYIHDVGTISQGQATSTPQDVYDLVQRHIGGEPIYSVHDQSYAEQLANAKQEARHGAEPAPNAPHRVVAKYGAGVHARIMEALADGNMTEDDWTPHEIDRMAELVGGGMDAGDAMQSVSQAGDSHDLGEIDQFIPGFDIPLPGERDAFWDPPFNDIGGDHVDAAAAPGQGQGVDQPGEAGPGPERQAGAPAPGEAAQGPGEAGPQPAEAGGPNEVERGPGPSSGSTFINGEPRDITLTAKGPWNFETTMPLPDAEQVARLEADGRNEFEGDDQHLWTIDEVAYTIDASLDEIAGYFAGVQSLAKISERVRNGTQKPPRNKTKAAYLEQLGREMAQGRQTARDHVAIYAYLFSRDAAAAMLRRGQLIARSYQEEAAPEPAPAPAPKPKAPAAAPAPTGKLSGAEFIAAIERTVDPNAPSVVGPDGRSYRIQKDNAAHAEDDAHIALRLPNKAGAPPTYFQPAPVDDYWDARTAAEHALDAASREADKASPSAGDLAEITQYLRAALPAGYTPYITHQETVEVTDPQHKVVREFSRKTKQAVLDRFLSRFPAKAAPEAAPAAAPLAEEPGAEGKPQAVIPGAEAKTPEQIAEAKAKAAREAAETQMKLRQQQSKLRKGGQQEAGGMFAPPPEKGLFEEPAAEAPKPAAYGAENKIVSKSKADELRAALKKKLDGTQLTAGIDPEILSLGAQLAAFHIEAGVRKFAAFAKAMAEDLGVEMAKIRPYLRMWYNGARDMMEDSGLDVGDMNTPDEVKAALKELDNAPGGSDVLEPDSGAAAPGDGVGGANVPAAPGGAGQGARPGGRAGGGGGGRRPGGRGRVPQSHAPAVGEEGNLELPPRQPDPPLSDAPTGEPLGSNPDSQQGLPIEPEPAGETLDLAEKTANLADRRARQRAAENTKVTGSTKANIAETLPMLFPEQQDDVHRIETRFAKPDGHGMLLTNGTGTGKTYSGLGVIKRFSKQGKNNILVVAPSQGILLDWIKEAKNLGLTITTLESATDKGQGIVATTYANLGENRHLADRTWDLVVADESHKLSADKEGTATKALTTLRALTLHPSGLRDRARMVLRADVDKAEAITNPEKRAEAMAALGNKMTPLIEKWRAEPRPKTLMMSATPFAHHFSLDYAEGYLFDFFRGERQGGYNAPSGRDLFYIQNLGYQMRTGRLTKPAAGVIQEVMERQLHEKLKRDGSLWGRALEVDKDYDRKFVTVDDAVGNRIDEALTFLQEADNGKFRYLADAVGKKFDYLTQRRLLEAIKARGAIDYIRKSLALGRKVVVFHDYNEGGGISPFSLTFAPGLEVHQFGPNGTTIVIKPAELYKEFLERNPWVEKLDFSQFKAPIEELTKAFPDALVYNGNVSVRNRNEAKRLFNTDGSGRDIIIVQSAAGEQGISLHDTTGRHQRVLVNLGMPARPTTALQEEGRIYRVGQMSDALFRYLNTGTNWERWTFAGSLATRSGTAENLAMGEQARTIRMAFVDSFSDTDTNTPTRGEGKGGKELDRALNNAVSEFDKAVTHYFAQQRTAGRRDQRAGRDYFATPEPIGLKMVEFANLKPGEKVLEPSAGHGAISRYFPETAARTLVEPSGELASRAALTSPGARVVNDSFENLDKVNKYDAIVMNPPFGQGGATAIQHLELAVGHLKNGGRIVAILPSGPAADGRFEKFMDSDAAKSIYQVADIKLPGVTFARAGSGVMTHIVVLEKQTDKEVVTPQGRQLDMSGTATIENLFDRIEDVEMPPRAEPITKDIEPLADGPMTAGGIDFDINAANGGFFADLKSFIPDRFRGVVAMAQRFGGMWVKPLKTFQFKTAKDRQDFMTGIVNGQDVGLVSAEAPKPTLAAGIKFKTAETRHAKTGEKLYVATAEGYVERDIYNALAQNAKAHGGWYSPYAKQGAIPGFQFKSAENRQKFMDDMGPKPERVGQAMRTEPAQSGPPVYYSAAIRTVEGLKQEKATPQQWLGMIRNAPGVKADELAVMELEDWLSKQEGTVTKAQLLDYMRANQLQVSEVVKGGSTAYGQQVAQLTNGRWIVADGESLMTLDDRALVREFETFATQEAAEQGLAKRKARATKFHQYQLPGVGEGYTEILVTLPNYGAGPMTREAGAFLDRMQAKYGQNWLPSATPEEGDEYQRLYNAVDKEGLPPEFTEGHFEEPNIVAHSRASVRTVNLPLTPEEQATVDKIKAGEAEAAKLDLPLQRLINKRHHEITQVEDDLRKKLMPEVAAGRITMGDARRALDQAAYETDTPGLKPLQELAAKRTAILNDLPAAPKNKTQRVLHVDEVQSDWHKRGRKQGYFNQKALDKAKAEVKRLYASVKEMLQRSDFLGYDAWSQAAAAISSERENIDQWDWETPEDRALAMEYRAAIQARRAADKATIPDAPFKTTWPELGFKRMLRYAAEQGLDGITWTTGKTQAERYPSELRKKISHISWKIEHGRKVVYAFPKIESGMATSHASNFTLDDRGVITHSSAVQAVGKNLEELVGKAMAKQILESEKGTIEAKDFIMGAKGFQDVYDKQLVAFANKVGKKFGVQVSQVEIPGEPADAVTGWETSDNRVIPSEPVTVHYLPINDALRESVMQGQPVFARESDIHGRPKYWAGFTPEQHAAELEKITAMVEKIIGRRVTVELKGRIDQGIAGRYRDAINHIEVALQTAYSTTEVTAHELMHALRDLGVFTDREWALLKRTVEGLTETGTEDGKTVTMLQRSRDLYQEEFERDTSMTPRQREEMYYEEAIARLFGNFYEGRELPSDWRVPNQVWTLADRVRQILEAFGNAFKGYGFHTAQGLMRKVKRGGFKRRRGVAPGVPGRGFHTFKAGPLGERMAKRQPLHMRVVPRRRNLPAPAPFEFEPDEHVMKALGDHTDTLLGRLKRAKAAFGPAFRRKMQDREIDWKRVEAAIRSSGQAIPEAQDVYLSMSVYPGQAAQVDKTLVDDVIKPWVADVHDAGLTLQDVDDFNEARHALERNQEIGKIHAPGSQFHEAMTDDTIVGGSGLSNAQAEAVLDSFVNRNMYDAVKAAGDRVVALNKRILKWKLIDGLISQDTYDTLTAKYKYYVPLRGFADPTDDEVPNAARVGKRYDIRGKEIQQAFGRRSRAASNTEYSFVQAREAFTRISKNRVGKTILRLAQANPNPAVWEVKPVRMKKVIDKTTGFVKEIRDPTTPLAENAFHTKVGGKSYDILIHHPGLLRAAKGFGDEGMNELLAVFHRAMRFFSAINTGWSPEFMLTNFFKDIVEGGINLSEEKIKGLTAKVIKSIPQAIIGMNREIQGDLSTTWARHAREMATAGGKVGYLTRADVATQHTELARLFSDMDPSKPRAVVLFAAKHVGKRIERWNDSIENGIRLATYVALREAGYSPARAAAADKELTVNFNRKGEWGPGINSLFMFFNARVQGTANLLMRQARSPRMRKIAGGIVVFALLQGLLNHWMAGDDDDDKNRYDKIDDAIKQRNFIIMLPKGSAVPYLHFPLPPGYGIFHIMGTQLAEMFNGARTPTEGAANIASGIANAFNPLSAGSDFIGSLVGLAPSILQPIFQIAFNRDYFGKKIVPDAYDQTTPYSHRYFPTTSPAAVQTAGYLNSLTGGNDVRSGAIDLAPAWFQHMWDFGTGGIGRLFSRTSAVAGQIKRGETPELSQIPFVRVFAGQTSKYSDRDEYYKMLDEITVTQNEMDMLRKRHDPEAIAQERKDRAREIKLGPVFTGAEKRLKALRERQKAIDLNTRMSADEKKAKILEIQAEKDRAMMIARKRWNDYQPAAP